MQNDALAAQMEGMTHEEQQQFLAAEMQNRVSQLHQAFLLFVADSGQLDGLLSQMLCTPHMMHALQSACIIYKVHVTLLVPRHALKRASSASSVLLRQPMAACSWSSCLQKSVKKLSHP